MDMVTQPTLKNGSGKKLKSNAITPEKWTAVKEGLKHSKVIGVAKFLGISKSVVYAIKKTDSFAKYDEIRNANLEIARARKLAKLSQEKPQEEAKVVDDTIPTKLDLEAFEVRMLESFSKLAQLVVNSYNNHDEKVEDKVVSEPELVILKHRILTPPEDTTYSGSDQQPYNYMTKRTYDNQTNIDELTNVLIGEGYRENAWMTEGQAKRKGLRVKHGELPVVIKSIYRDRVIDEEGNKREVGPIKNHESRVYNIEQTERRYRVAV